jgi:hypothetical protein
MGSGTAPDRRAATDPNPQRLPQKEFAQLGLQGQDE